MKLSEPETYSILEARPGESAAPTRPLLLNVRLSVLIFFAFAAMGSWVPVFTLHLENLDFTPSEAAWASAANAIGAMLAPLIWGQIADRWVAKERCISLCGLVTGALLWVLAGLRDPHAVVAVCLVLWFFLIPVIGLTGAFIFRLLEHPERDYGKIRLWGTLGWMAPNWGLTWWYLNAGWLSGADAPPTVDLGDSLRLGALAGFVVAIFALTMPHAPPSPAVHDERRPRSWLIRLTDAPVRALQLFRQRAFFVYCACMFGYFITVPFTVQLNPLLLDRIGVPRPDVPLYLTICQSTEIVLLACLPMLLTRFGAKATMLAGGLAWTVGLTALSVGTPTCLVLTALSTGGFFICCFVISGQVFVHARATPDIRASAQGVLMLISGSGLLLGHFLVGLIRNVTDDDYAFAYRVAAISSAVLFVLFAAGFTTAPARTPANSAPDRLVPQSEMT